LTGCECLTEEIQERYVACNERLTKVSQTFYEASKMGKIPYDSLDEMKGAVKYLDWQTSSLISSIRDYNQLCSNTVDCQSMASYKSEDSVFSQNWSEIRQNLREKQKKDLIDKNRLEDIFHSEKEIR
jgi:hypothetical protein